MPRARVRSPSVAVAVLYQLVPVLGLRPSPAPCPRHSRLSAAGLVPGSLPLSAVGGRGPLGRPSCTPHAGPHAEHQHFFAQSGVVRAEKMGTLMRGKGGGSHVQHKRPRTGVLESWFVRAPECCCACSCVLASLCLCAAACCRHQDGGAAGDGGSCIHSH